MTPGHADRYLVCPQHGRICRVVGVFGRRPENMRENMLENVRGRNFSVGHLDFYDPLLLRAPPNSPHSWLAPLTPRLGGRCPPNPTARCGQLYAPTAQLRPKSRFCRLRAGPRFAATPPDGLPQSACESGHIGGRRQHLVVSTEHREGVRRAPRADLRHVYMPADVAEGTGSGRALAAAARRYRCERGTFCKCQERRCTTTAILRDGVDGARWPQNSENVFGNLCFGSTKPTFIWNHNIWRFQRAAQLCGRLLSIL